MKATMDGGAFKRMVLSAAAMIENKKQSINELNVFPVPDGDTGTNMSLTLHMAANDLLNIKGVKGSFVCTPYQDKVYISARSIDEVNVQIIMERMGGGGHINMAGCQLEGVTVEEAMAQLKFTLDKMLDEGDI